MNLNESKLYYKLRQHKFNLKNNCNRGEQQSFNLSIKEIYLLMYLIENNTITNINNFKEV